MNKPRIQSPRSSYYADSVDMFELFGLKGETHWPDKGMEARIIQGIKVWVTAKPIKFRIEKWSGKQVYVKSSQHRVLCECPNCAQVLSVGRLHQHKCKGSK